MKTLEQLGNACKQASRQIMNADRNQKDALLRAIAKQLEQDMPAILKANALDVENGKANGMNAGLLDRMLLNEARMQRDYRGWVSGMCITDPYRRNHRYAYYRKRIADWNHACCTGCRRHDL